MLSIELEVSSLMNCFESLILSKRFHEFLSPRVTEIVFYLIAIMQLTERQLNLWKSDINEFYMDLNFTETYRFYGVRILDVFTLINFS